MAEYYTGPNNSAPLVGITAALSGLATLLAIWRFSHRIYVGVIGLSDYLLGLALILALCQAGFNISASVKWGYGYHKADLPPAIRDSATPRILFFINQVFFKVETGLTKMSICVIYMNIFRNAVARRVRTAQTVNYVLAAVIGCYYTAGSFVSLLQCKPISKAWTATIPGTCIDNDQFRLANGYINIITSVWLICMPFPVLVGVKHRKRELWEFLGLVSLGVIHTGCAVWRVVLMYDPPAGPPDTQWNNTEGNTIAMVEEFVGIMAATIIVMRPCFAIFSKKTLGMISTLKSSTTTSAARKNSRHRSAATDSRKNHTDLEGFNKLPVSREIELESRNQSTEEILKD